jgi:hypothetical protein
MIPFLVVVFVCLIASLMTTLTNTEIAQEILILTSILQLFSLVIVGVIIMNLTEQPEKYEVSNLKKIYEHNGIKIYTSTEDADSVLPIKKP